ncbi:MAG: UDP-N-acetylmuramoyl-L-alanyl-D-glutamate--2,6-diaminopimelate ligase [Desulfobacterales bacterium]|nr:UDP-N-acetylmuramoyl-L-alanyl-D-glutamate--2,6-diaminopimelate ligase [Desulfobacterales bacterium]
MRLSLLIEAIYSELEVEQAHPVPADLMDMEIPAIHYRSDSVIPGGVFVAIKGQRADGHSFVSDAVSRGAAAVIIDRDVAGVKDAVMLRVDNSRKALALLAARFYGNPSDRLVMIGITGTNGKTTIAYLIERMLAMQKVPVGVIGTINYRYGGRIFDNPLTTPEAPELQCILAEMADAGVTHVVMEVSSHGIALERVRGCLFDVGVFTNLTQDHLDFHRDMGAYWEAKKQLFTAYLDPKSGKGAGSAVIHTADKRGRELAAELAHCPIIRVGMDAQNTVYPTHTAFDQTGTRANIHMGEGELTIRSGLAGRFNLENILCAAAVGRVLGVPPEGIKAGIESVSNIPGRMERISDAAGRHVFVDYAHTPNALENVLETLREINPGRLICVFGCGGDRDMDKRPKMGAIAASKSDLVIITSDNPRTESPMDIIEAIRIGAHRVLPRRLSAAELEDDLGSTGYVVEPDREKAILLGIRISKPGDTVLIAGKGHETYQIVGSRILDFDDRKIAEQGLSLN